MCLSMIIKFKEGLNDIVDLTSQHDKCFNVICNFRRKLMKMYRNKSMHIYTSFCNALFFCYETWKWDGTLERKSREVWLETGQEFDGCHARQRPFCPSKTHPIKMSLKWHINLQFSFFMWKTPKIYTSHMTC